MQHFAEYVRIPLENARALADGWRRVAVQAGTEEITGGAHITGATEVRVLRALHAEWIEQQRPRWQAEAASAIDLLDTMAEAQRQAHART